MAKITQILLFSVMKVLERSKITVLNNTLSKKFSAMEVLDLYLPYMKRYFQEHQQIIFFFVAQITQTLLFSGMPLLERSKITV